MAAFKITLLHSKFHFAKLDFIKISSKLVTIHIRVIVKIVVTLTTMKSLGFESSISNTLHLCLLKLMVFLLLKVLKFNYIFKENKRQF